MADLARRSDPEFAVGRRGAADDLVGMAGIAQDLVEEDVRFLAPAHDDCLLAEGDVPLGFQQQVTEGQAPGGEEHQRVEEGEDEEVARDRRAGT